MNFNDFLFPFLLVVFGVFIIASLFDFIISIKKAIKILRKREEQPTQTLMEKLYQEHNYVLFVNPSNDLIYYDKTMIGIIYGVSDATIEFPETEFEMLDKDERTKNICFKCLIENIETND